MSDRFVATDDVIERMLQRRAARGDFTGLMRQTADAVAITPAPRAGWVRRHSAGDWHVPRLRGGIGVAVVITIAIITVAILDRPWQASIIGPVASPSVTPAVSPSPTPTPSPSPTRSAVASPAAEPTPPLALAAGTYTSRTWKPRLTYTVPDGWWNDADDPTGFALGKGHESPDNIELLVDLYPPGADCGMVPDWTRLHGVDDLMDYLAGNPAIEVISREAVSLGGLDGWHVVIQASASSSCETATMAFMVHWHDGIPFGHSASGRQEFTFLDGPDGRTIGIVVRAEGAIRDEATAIVDSFEFDLASETPDKGQSQVFVPRLTFTAHAAWGITEEDVAMLSLRRGSADSIDVIANVFPPTIDRDGCQRGITMGRDSADRMVAYWTSHPGLVASTPERFPIGDVAGWRVDVSRDPDWKQSPKCTDEMFDGPVDFLHLWKGNGAVQGSGIGGTRKTLIVLDLPDGPTIGIKFAFRDTPALEEETLAIVRSFAFAASP